MSKWRFWKPDPKCYFVRDGNCLLGGKGLCFLRLCWTITVNDLDTKDHVALMIAKRVALRTHVAILISIGSLIVAAASLLLGEGDLLTLLRNVGLL